MKLLYMLIMACLMGAVLTACTSTSDRYETSSSREDADLAYTVKTRLQSDSFVSNYAVGIRVAYGTVTVFGVVPNEGARLRVLTIIDNTPGVLRIKDQMHVQSP